MRTLVPPCLLWLACTPPTPPPPPAPVPQPPPPSPLEAPPCPADEHPFSFGSLRVPTFAEAPTEAMLRTYQGQVEVPSESGLDLSAMWLLDEPVTVLSIEEIDHNLRATYEVQATCTSCDHASLRIGSISSAIVLTTPTSPAGSPVAANFSYTSTAWMVLGISSSTTPEAAIAAPINYAERPDLNPFLGDVIAAINDGVALQNSTGVSPHGLPLNGSTTLLGVDDVLAGSHAPPPRAVPWLLPIAQVGLGESLVVWGPLGRSAAIPAIDGRFLFDLPLEQRPAAYSFRFVSATHQSRARELRYPPSAGFGALQVSTSPNGVEVRGPEHAWMALHTPVGDPMICQADANGRTLFPAATDTTLEIAAVDANTLELLGHTVCSEEVGCR